MLRFFFFFFHFLEINISCNNNCFFFSPNTLDFTDPFYIVVEFLANGNLKDFLVKSRVENAYANTRVQDMKSTLSAAQLLMFAKQAADGMAHIAEQKVSRRRLASKGINFSPLFCGKPEMDMTLSSMELMFKLKISNVIQQIESADWREPDISVISTVLWFREALWSNCLDTIDFRLEIPVFLYCFM